MKLPGKMEGCVKLNQKASGTCWLTEGRTVISQERLRVLLKLSVPLLLSFYAAVTTVEQLKESKCIQVVKMVQMLYQEQNRVLNSNFLGKFCRYKLIQKAIFACRLSKGRIISI